MGQECAKFPRDLLADAEAALKAPHAIQWLSDNGPPYTATASVLYAHELGLMPITTPAYSPESNGLAEAFVHRFKGDYVNGGELRDAETVLVQLGHAPHSALGMRRSTEYRATLELILANRGANQKRQTLRGCPGPC